MTTISDTYVTLNDTYVTLNNGQKMPVLGLGTWNSKPGEVQAAVEAAIKCGYRHIDCAYCYGNEKEVGEGIKAAGVERSQLFITSKLWNNKHHPEGLVRSIGVSNFNSKQVADICEKGTITPVMNQPSRCKRTENSLPAEKKVPDRGIQKVLLTAYSPLGSPDRPWAKPEDEKLLDNPKLVAMAQKYNKSSAQVLIRWQIQRGVAVIPKSVTPSRIQENADVFDFLLSDQE